MAEVAACAMSKGSSLLTEELRAEDLAAEEKVEAVDADNHEEESEKEEDAENEAGRSALINIPR